MGNRSEQETGKSLSGGEMPGGKGTRPAGQEVGA